jgi:hypothetical protein
MDGKARFCCRFRNSRKSPSFENPCPSLVLTPPAGIHGRPVLVNAWSCGESNAISTGCEGEVVVLLNQYQNVYGVPPLFFVIPPSHPLPCQLPSLRMYHFFITPYVLKTTTP